VGQRQLSSEDMCSAIIFHSQSAAEPIESKLNSDADNKTIFDTIVITGLPEDATINQMHAAALLHMKEKQGGFVQIPHSGQPANEFYNPNQLPIDLSNTFPVWFRRL
jgi:hypothetical protein